MAGHFSSEKTDQAGERMFWLIRIGTTKSLSLPGKPRLTKVTLAKVQRGRGICIGVVVGEHFTRASLSPEEAITIGHCESTVSEGVNYVRVFGEVKERGR